MCRLSVRISDKPFSNSSKVETSCPVWNNNHVDEEHNVAFLDVLAHCAKHTQSGGDL